MKKWHRLVMTIPVPTAVVTQRLTVLSTTTTVEMLLVIQIGSLNPTIVPHHGGDCSREEWPNAKSVRQK